MNSNPLRATDQSEIEKKAEFDRLKAALPWAESGFRRALRITHPALHGLDVSVTFPSGDEFRNIKITEASPIGFGLSFGKIELKGEDQTKDSTVAMRIYDTSVLVATIPCRLVYSKYDGKELHGGFERLDFLGTIPSPLCDEESAPIAVVTEHPLAARARHPVFFNDQMRLRIELIEQGLRIRCRSDDPKLFLFHRARVSIRFNMNPSVEETASEFEVEWLAMDDKKGVIFRARPISIPEKTCEFLVDYLLENYPVTPLRLRKLGFFVNKISFHFMFRYARSFSDYAQVLSLRRIAYVDAGKRPDTALPEDFANPHDGMGNVLCLFHGTQVVASIAATMPMSRFESIRTERFFPKGMPTSFPPKEDLIEVWALCTHPEYRGSDIFISVLREVFRLFILSGRKYILSNTTDVLWPLYKRIGFRKTGHSFPVPEYSGLVHHVIVADRERGLTGSLFLPAWIYVLGPFVQSLLAKKALNELGWLKRTTLRGRLLLLPILQGLRRREQQQKYLKHMHKIINLGPTDKFN